MPASCGRFVVVGLPCSRIALPGDFGWKREEEEEEERLNLLSKERAVIHDLIGRHRNGVVR